MSGLRRFCWPLLCAVLAAIAVQPLVFVVVALWPALIDGEVSADELLSIGLTVMAVAGAVVLLLGLPAFFLLRRLGRAGPVGLGTVGFLIPAVIVAWLGWPGGTASSGYSSGGNWHGHPVEFFINGHATLYGWLEYGESIMRYGLHGLTGALAFGAIWQRLAEPHEVLAGGRRP